MRLAISVILLGCASAPQPAGDDSSVSPDDAGVDSIRDTRRDLDSITEDTTVDEVATDTAAPPRIPCEIPNPGPTKCPAGGCVVEVIAKGQTVVSSLLDGGTELFFTTGDAMGTSGTVKRMSKSTFTAKSFAGGTYPSGIALSDTEIFWANFDNTDPVYWGAVKKRTRADVYAPPTTLVAMEPQTLRLTYAEGYIFWTRLTGGLYRVSAGGGSRKLLVENAWAGPVVAEDHLVFFESDPVSRDSWLSKMPIPGGVVSRLSQVGGSPFLAWSSGYAVWTDESAGRVWRACTDMPSEAKQLVFGVDRPVPIAVRDGWVYFAERAKSVQRIPLEGGTPVVLATGARNVSGIVVDDDWVYWSDFDLGTISRTAR